MLAERVQRHNRKRESRESELSALKKTVMDRFNSLEPQYSYNMVIRDELPEDGIACFDITQLGYVAWFGFPTYQPSNTGSRWLPGDPGVCRADGHGRSGRQS